MDEKQIRWGIIGPGHIARSFAKALSARAKTNPNLVCHAVASRDASRAQSFAAEFGFNKSYSSYEDLLGDPDVDVVYIATPHTFHAQQALMALRAGKSVVCEKPAAVNSALLQQVIDTAQEKNLFFLEATWSAFNPTVLGALEWIRQGRIGNVVAVDCAFCFRNEYNPQSRLFNPALAGGALLDVGIYPVTFSMLVAKAADEMKGMRRSFSIPITVAEPRKVVSTARLSNGIDAANFINLQFACGMDAHLMSAVDMEPAANAKDAYIYGTKGYIKVPLFWMSQEAYLYEYDGASTAAAHEVEHSSHPFDVNGYEYEIDAAMDALGKGQGQCSLHSLYDSLAVCKVLDSCRSQWKMEYPFEKEMMQLLAQETAEESTEAESDAELSRPLTVYTDGGCSGNPGKGGWGCVIIDGSKETRLSGGDKNTTNNKMELTAAINALSAAARNPEWKGREITVFCDSQYVKNGITGWIFSWKKNGWKTAAKKPVLNRELWEELDELNRKLNVKWQWVKGHAGIKYNEICDQLCQMEMAKL